MLAELQGYVTILHDVALSRSEWGGEPEPSAQLLQGGGSLAIHRDAVL